LYRNVRTCPLFTSRIVQSLLEGCTYVSLDLGISKTSVIIREDYVFLPEGEVIELSELREVPDRENAVFFFEKGILHMVAISNGHFYKLVPTEGAPTLEIDGIRMHRTKVGTPETNAMSKVEALGIRGGLVLDTCTGLGYTTLASLEKGAELVVSVELRPEVLYIAEMNPWSTRLFQDPGVHLILGDSYNTLDSFPQGCFDYIIHDPPRLSLAGHLYGLSFYKKLFDALSGGGGLFHYIGRPGSKSRRINLRRGVTQRLGLAGFKKINYHENIQGVICRKP
jgi:predicted methyltransferase